MKRFCLALLLALSVLSVEPFLPVVADAQIGRLFMAFRGAYSGSISYVQGDMVSVNSAFYISLVWNNLGNAPASSPTQWAVITPSFAAQSAGTLLGNCTAGTTTPSFCAITPPMLPVFGAAGSGHSPGAVPDPGVTTGLGRVLGDTGWITPAGMNFRGNYASGAPYAVGDTVTDVGVSYVSLVAPNTGNTPAASGAQWQALGAPTPANIPIGGYEYVVKTAGVGGVLANTLVKFDSSGNVIQSLTSDSGAFGVAVSTATQGNPVNVALFGTATCIADNTTAINDLVTVGTTTAGYCRDTGTSSAATLPITSGKIGRFLSVASTGSPALVQLYGPGHQGDALPAASSTVPGTVLLSVGMSPTLQSAANHPATDFDAAGAAATVQGSGLQKASNLSDLANAATARTNLGLGTAATQAATSFDAAGVSAAETAARVAANALLAPLASPALTGSPTAPTASAGDASTRIATDGFVATAINASQAATSTSGLIADYILPSLVDQTGISGNLTNCTSGTPTASPVTGSVFSYVGTGSNPCFNLPSSITTITSVEIFYTINPPVFSQAADPTTLYIPTLIGPSTANGATAPEFTLGQVSTNGRFRPYFITSTYISGVNDLVSGYNETTFTCATGAGNSHIYINGAESQAYSNTGTCAGVTLGSGNFVIGSGNANAGAFNGTIYRVRIFNTQISATTEATDYAAITQSLRSKGVSTQPPVYRYSSPIFIAEGDSLTSAAGLTVAQSWANNLSISPYSYTPKLTSIFGIPILGLIGNAPWRTLNQCQTTSGPNILSIWAGTNDLANGSATVMQVEANLAAYAALGKAAGCKVFIGTMISRTGTASGMGSITLDAAAQILNPDIRAKAKSWGADGVFDFAGTPLLGATGANTGSCFQSDHIHITAACQLTLAGFASKEILRSFGNTSSTPTPVSTSTYAMAAGDNFISGNPTPNNVAITALSCAGLTTPRVIHNVQNTGANTLTLLTASSVETIDGTDYSSAGLVIPNGTTLTLDPVILNQATAQCTWARR